MQYRAQQLFYTLSIFLLLTAIFIFRPSSVPEVASLQTDMQQKFSIAWQQTMGDGSYFDGFINIYDGITDFYNQAADSTIALLSQPQQDQEIYFALSTTYQTLADMMKDSFQGMTANKEVAIQLESKTANSDLTISNPSPGQVSGSNTQITPVPNRTNSWVTISDNATGELYCLAIYNGEVNKYPGPCPDESNNKDQTNAEAPAGEKTWVPKVYQIPRARAASF